MTLNRRHFLFLLGTATGAFALDACAFADNRSQTSATPTPTTAPTAGAFQLPPLPYAYNALEPYIDANTMGFHHDKHHATYVKNLNAAIAKHPELNGKTGEQLLRDLKNIPEDIRKVVQNNGGGHVNHSMFWKIMKPKGGGAPTGAIATAINQNFGSFDAFKKQFNEAGASRFGSGWAWLIRTPDGKLAVTSTANQDSPFTDGNYPIMGNDVWEHAYYLNYQNRRADYLTAWWNVLNWDEINNRFAQASKTA
ncbi:MAG: superoxide dismutase [Nostocaceae cyanobacterium]|nr:superoxide dismutase [Nostocaceae cyanobacterium]